MKVVSGSEANPIACQEAILIPGVFGCIACVSARPSSPNPFHAAAHR